MYSSHCQCLNAWQIVDSGKPGDRVEVTTKVSDVYAKDSEASPCEVNDMTKLAYSHEPGVLQKFKYKYDMNEIYTYAGNIVVTVNPIQRLPHLHDIHMMQKYKGTAIEELSRHPFAVADAAYRYANHQPMQHNHF